MLGRTQCSWDQSCWCWLWCWHRQSWPSRVRRTGRGLVPPSFAVDGGRWKLWESEKTSGVVYPPTLATSPFCRLLPPRYLIFILWTHRNKIGIFLWEIPTLKSKLASWHTVLFSHGLNRCQKSTSGCIYARKKSNWQTESAAAATVHNQITTEKKRSELLSIPTYVSDLPLLSSSNCSALVRFELWWSYLKSPSVQLRLKTSNTYTTYRERKKKNTPPDRGLWGIDCVVQICNTVRNSQRSRARQRTLY